MPRVRLTEATPVTQADTLVDAMISPSGVQTFSSGSKLLDLVLGGGWAEGRVANLVGDRSTGKTLLAIEACASFAKKHEDGRIRYREVEAAFDDSYAESLGLPLDRLDNLDSDEPCDTVEHFFADLEAFTKSLKKNQPGFYILDSLDALSDDAEMAADMTKGTFGAAKAKKMSQLFRRCIRLLKTKNVTVLIISQLRDKIGVTFGETQSRSGGRALDFYASQVIWLANLGQIKKTKNEVERTIGVRIRAKCKKNKVGLPFRECEFPIMFGYGVDDIVSIVEWFAEIKCLSLIGFEDGMSDKASAPVITKSVRQANALDDKEYRKKRRELAKVASKKWIEIDKSFMPVRRKY